VIERVMMMLDLGFVALSVGFLVLSLWLISGFERLRGS
jgi:hypothetical protein